jgi:glycosyltransferase involved in cell wall biosynthesis
MRIAVVTRTLARIGGVEAYVEQSVTGLGAAGHEACVFAEDRPEAGLAVPAWMPRDGVRPALDAAVHAYAPDVVISHGVGSPALQEALTGVRPSVFFAHAYHGTCISGAKAHSFPGVHACQRTLGAGCLLRYYPRRCGGLSPVTMIGQYALQRRHLASVRMHERVFALSAHIADEYARHGVPRDRIRVLPPPVPGVITAQDTTADPAHVVYLGRLERLKGPAIAVAAVAAASVLLPRPLRLTIAGEGSGLADIQQAVSRVPPGSLREVRLVGQLAPHDRDALLASAALLVVPSVWPEPFGMVGYEAGAHGVPVAGLRVGGIPEWLTEGINGHVADPYPEPIAALRDAIVLALADGRHYTALRAGARAAHAAAAARDHVGALARALEEVVLEKAYA